MYLTQKERNPGQAECTKVTPGALKEPVLAQNVPFGDLGEPRETRFGPDCPDRPGWVELVVTTHFDLVSGLFWALKVPFWPKMSVSLNSHGLILCGTFLLAPKELYT